MSELFLLFVQYAMDVRKALPPPPIGDVIGVTFGPWEARFNRSRDEREGIPPFHVLLLRNGWPAGLLSADGGVINGEDEVCDALKAEIRAAGMVPCSEWSAAKEGA